MALVIVSMLLTSGGLAVFGLGFLGLATEAKIPMRKYQVPVFADFETKVLIVDWSRQIGKSFTMANWAVRRILQQLQTYDSWLVVVLSNSKDNGSEFAMKVSEVCRAMGQVIEEEFPADLDTVKYEDMKFQINIKVGRKLGRVKILAASPRTARGFSGDLILDEFAFHEDDTAIWEAAEPIITANTEYLCRICSTRNGTKKLFHHLATSGIFPVNRMRRSEAWAGGEIKIVSLTKKNPLTGKPLEITPEQAEAEAIDKKAYRQNYECESANEMGSVLTWEDIQKAETLAAFGFDDQAWTAASLARIYRAKAEGELFAGVDVARVGDFTVVSVALKGADGKRRLIGLLRMRDMRLPAQNRQIDLIMDHVTRVHMDSTGLGLGLYEYAQEKHGNKVVGINFSTKVSIENRPEMIADGRKAITAPVTEVMALDLAKSFADCQWEIPLDQWLRNDLHNPERQVTATGRVTIAATRDAKGHADGFWSIALCEHAMREGFSDTWTEEDCAGVMMGTSEQFGHPMIHHFGRLMKSLWEALKFGDPSEDRGSPRPSDLMGGYGAKYGLSAPFCTLRSATSGLFGQNLTFYEA